VNENGITKIGKHFIMVNYFTSVFSEANKERKGKEKKKNQNKKTNENKKTRM
jgi:hypothetical protein